MKSRIPFILSALILAIHAQPAARLGLHEVDLSAMTHGTGRGVALPDRSVANGPLSIAGEKFTHGVGTRAFSTFILELDGRADLLTGKAGADDAGKTGTVRCRVLGDRRVLWDSGIMRAGDRARPFTVPLEGVRVLAFLVTDAGDGNRQDFADWVDVEIAYRGQAPVPAAWLNERPYLLTPPAPAAPHLNGPKLTGVRPGAPFLFRIPCTGERPIAFSVTGLPAGLMLDPATGDAQTFAEWGFDFLKYDWCTYEKIAPDHSLLELQLPFRLMRGELRKQARDIQFNLCQYGMGRVWTWAGELGESWRTTDDLGLTGRLKARDLWRQQDLGTFSHSFTATVPFHGVSLLRVESLP